jgi:poly-beta-1,6-N-acetyl-D-glucosamine synthase
MTAAETLFWLCLAALFYCYLGYGFLLYAGNRLKKLFMGPRKTPSRDLLPVTLVVAAYNEEAVLERKIANTLQLDYPRELLHVIFITDGSTDHSCGLIRQHDFINLLHQNERKGKSAALKRAMRFVHTPIVIFSDANSMLNPGCIKAMMPHYADPGTGGVAGEKKIMNDDQVSVVGQAEGLYWKYESFMKKQDADFNTVAGAAGELFSIRTALFYPLEEHLILDDFILSMQVCLQGYKIAYEPSAYAVELPSASLGDEERRKVRIAAGAFQSIYYLRHCLNIFRYPRLGFQYISRRLLRWIACPVLIFLLFISNTWLVVNTQGLVFDYFLIAQGIFYLLALAGRIFITLSWKMGILNIPFYFVFMNLCMVKGFFRYLQGRQSVLWEKSMREVVAD